MGFLSGPASFQRFFVTGKLTRDVTDEFVRDIQEHAFGTGGPTAEGVEAGWIGPRHIFETQIDADRIAYGRFVLLGLRVDRAKVPANVLRGYIRQEEDAALDASGREFLNKTEKRKAREKAVARGDKELRGGAFRKISAYPNLIDLEGKTVYCGALGSAVADRLMQTFSDTFGAGLEPATPERIAARLLTDRKNARALETLTPFRLARPPRGIDEEHGAGISTDQNWLGKELLSWLWFHSEQDAALKVSSGDDVTVMIDRTLRMKCDYDLTGNDTISADAPTSLPEAKAALRIGKQPVKAGLILGSPLGEVRLTLDAARFAISGMAVPEEQIEGDFRARCEHRFEQLVDAAGLLDGLFDLFLQQRCARDWNAQQRAMAAWATGQPAESLARAAR